MIEVNNLSKKYDNITVLDIPKLSIAEGESFGLVGNNGAGKTTFFRLILDLIEASTGEVSINGQRVARNDNWKPWVGSFLDEGFLIDFFTPDEFFAFTGKMYGKSTGDINTFLASMEEFFNGEIIGTKRIYTRPIERQPEESWHSLGSYWRTSNTNTRRTVYCSRPVVADTAQTIAQRLAKQ